MADGWRSIRPRPSEPTGSNDPQTSGSGFAQMRSSPEATSRQALGDPRRVPNRPLEWPKDREAYMIFYLRVTGAAWEDIAYDVNLQRQKKRGKPWNQTDVKGNFQDHAESIAIEAGIEDFDLDRWIPQIRLLKPISAASLEYVMNAGNFTFHNSDEQVPDDSVPNPGAGSEGQTSGVQVISSERTPVVLRANRWDDYEARKSHAIPDFTRPRTADGSGVPTEMTDLQFEETEARRRRTLWANDPIAAEEADSMGASSVKLPAWKRGNWAEKFEAQRNEDRRNQR
ncbi:hypothetical protein MBLNU459_g8018t2 [Dothideomycetes sp. NU459]